MNGKLLVLLAAALSTVPCWAKIQVSGSRISFDEALTEQNISQAIADFQKKRGTFRRISLELKKCSDADLALAAEKFSNFQSIQLSIKDCPALTSLAPLKKLGGITRLTLEKTPLVKDVSALGDCTALEQLSLKKVGFVSADLSFCSRLTRLRSLEISHAPATFKSAAGIENCGGLRTFNLSYNGGLVDLSALSALPLLGTVALQYVHGLDLAPVAKLLKLNYLNLYGSSDLDLAPLSASKTLKRIMIYATKRIRDYNALASIKTLEDVHAGLSQMDDLSWAPQLPKLKKLQIFAETYKSYEPLGRCAALEELKIWRMRHTVDVAQFADGLSKAPLKKLSLSGTEIQNEAKLAVLAASPLEDLNLSSVNPKSKKTVDLTWVGSLEKLKTLNLDGTKIANFAAVGKCRNLRSLNAECDGFDLSVAESLPLLQTLKVERTMKAEAEKKLAPRKVRVF